MVFNVQFYHYAEQKKGVNMYIVHDTCTHTS